MNFAKFTVSAGAALRCGQGWGRASVLVRGGELPGRTGKGDQGALRPPYQNEEGRRRRRPHDCRQGVAREVVIESVRMEKRGISDLLLPLTNKSNPFVKLITG